ncbi:hypothetical protein TKK_0003733 [Trichogramma kaykai]
MHDKTLPNLSCSKGNSLLHVACKLGNSNYLQAYVEESIFQDGLESTREYNMINLRNSDGNNLIYVAAIKGHVQIVINLLKMGINPTGVTEGGNDIFHRLALDRSFQDNEAARAMMNHLEETNAIRTSSFCR